MPKSLTPRTRYATFPVMGRHGNKRCLQLKKWYLKPWEWMSSSKREYEKKDNYRTQHLGGRVMRKMMRQGDYTTQQLGGSNGDLAELQQIRGRKKNKWKS